MRGEEARGLSRGWRRVLTVALVAGFAKDAWAGSDKPPAGAPWTMDFGAALEAAAKDGRPIFLYFTKTY